MRQLEHKLNQTRGVLRRAWSRLASVDPEMVAPARLVLQLDDRDLPGTMGTGKELSPFEWNQAIAQVIEWLGPVPVTVIATRNSADVQVPELIRFAHRLECPTTLVTDGTGIDEDKAIELLSSGLSAVRFLVGGVSDEVQQRTVGNDAVAATGAVWHVKRFAGDPRPNDPKWSWNCNSYVSCFVLSRAGGGRGGAVQRAGAPPVRPHVQCTPTQASTVLIISKR